jgi:hypothetical protein
MSRPRRDRRHGWRLGVLALALLATASLGPARAQMETPQDEAEETPSCYDRASQSSRLSDEQALRLCGAALSEGPAVCFEAAVERTDLTTDDAITLCQCAPSVAPVNCYRRGLEASLLTSDALRMCTQTYSSLFPPVCLH